MITANINRRSPKKHGLAKKVAIFLIFELIFTGLTLPLYALYGPFKDIRNMIVGLSMATGNHQYIAKMFFSNEKIDSILDEENRKLNGQASPRPSIEGKIDMNLSDELIERIDINTNKFVGTALIVKDPKKVRVGYSSKIGRSGETVTDMAQRYGALAAINGGGYSDVSPTGRTGGTGGIPCGIIISDGNVIYPSEKKDFDNQTECLFSIDSDGKMYVGPASVNDLLERNVRQAVSFAPTLVVNGEPYISENALVGLNPRTAIGQRQDGSIIMLAIDGRQGLKLGASLKDVQGIMIDLGAENAMCLDGGGSTAMYYKDEIINHPSSVTGERAMPDIIYVEP